MRRDLTFGLLGPLEVTSGGKQVSIASAKQRVLLASLLINANDVVSVETLTRYMWGDRPPAGARNTLQNHVMRLRRTLDTGPGPSPLRSHATGYSIEVDDDAIDVRRFESLLARAREAALDEDLVRASELLGDALRLWRGEPLADVMSDELQAHARPSLEERKLAVLAERIDVDLRLDRHHDVLGELRELTTRYPFVEGFWAQRIRALQRAGRSGEALMCYHEAAGRFVEELGVEPGHELRELHSKILRGEPEAVRPARPASRERWSGNLPSEVTSFVGRDDQVARTCATLEKARIVTLTGIGGVGKTRLALRVGEAVAPTFRDGVWFVDLAAVTGSGLVCRAVAEALDIRDQSLRDSVQFLSGRLRDRQLLLVLDNCEHLAAEVAELVAVLLRTVAGLRVLATSRRTLAVHGEHVLAVPPLGLPIDGSSPTRSEAVQLLVERATAAAADFSVDDHDLDDVVRLCRRLDGIPLAIELAAVRLSSLSVREVLDRLDDRFGLLSARLDPSSPPMPQADRQTLRGVMDWSYELCSEAEKRLWAHLSVFAGGFDLAAAESVCQQAASEPQQIVDLLARLVGQSVLVADSRTGRTRYLMLETIRQYGLSRLAEHGGEERLRHLHYAYFRGMAARAAAENTGTRHEVEWQHRLEQDLPNLRAAMDYGSTMPGDPGGAVRMATDLSRLSFFTGRLRESREWLSTTRRRPDIPADLRTTAMAFEAWIATVLGDHDAAQALLDRCSAEAAPAAVLFAHGNVEMFVNTSPAAIDLLARSVRTFRDEGADAHAHVATIFWAMAAVALGDRDTAIGASTAWLEEARRQAGVWTYTWALWASGIAELKYGRPQRAAEQLREALDRQLEIGDRWGPIWSTEALGWAVAANGAHQEAAALLDRARTLRAETGIELVGLFLETHHRIDHMVRAALTR
ncbi:BTAD domain-containing putative transcriptional regulator [Actinomycetes bacterium KLBMP 9759]